MPLSRRVLPLYTTRLVTVAVANKKNPDHGYTMPSNAKFCRDLRTKPIVHFYQKIR